MIHVKYKVGAGLLDYSGETCTQHLTRLPHQYHAYIVCIRGHPPTVNFGAFDERPLDISQLLKHPSAACLGGFKTTRKSIPPRKRHPPKDQMQRHWRGEEQFSANIPWGSQASENFRWPVVDPPQQLG